MGPTENCLSRPRLQRPNPGQPCSHRARDSEARANQRWRQTGAGRKPQDHRRWPPDFGSTAGTAPSADVLYSKYQFTRKWGEEDHTRTPALRRG
jgi:hypothetical protein